MVLVFEMARTAVWLDSSIIQADEVSHSHLFFCRHVDRADIPDKIGDMVITPALLDDYQGHGK